MFFYNWPTLSNQNPLTTGMFTQSSPLAPPVPSAFDLVVDYNADQVIIFNGDDVEAVKP
jgi:hypothetical protein